MSLGLVFGAADGLLILGDGRRTIRRDDGMLVPDRDDHVKTVIAPKGLPIVAVTTGTDALRVNGTLEAPVTRWVYFHIEDRLDELRPDELTLESLANSLGDRLLEGLGYDLQQRKDTRTGDPDQLQPSTVELLLAGYSPGASTSEVYRITADLDDLESPSMRVPCFDRRPIALVPARPEGFGAQFEQMGMVADLVEQQFHSDAGPEDVNSDTLTGLDLAQLRVRVLAGLAELIARDRATFDKYYVGGDWTVIEVRPGDAPTSSVEPLGPYIER